MVIHCLYWKSCFIKSFPLNKKIKKKRTKKEKKKALLRRQIRQPGPGAHHLIGSCQDLFWILRMHSAEKEREISGFILTIWCAGILICLFFFFGQGQIKVIGLSYVTEIEYEGFQVSSFHLSCLSLHKIFALIGSCCATYIKSKGERKFARLRVSQKGKSWWYWWQLGKTFNVTWNCKEGIMYNSQH